MHFLGAKAKKGYDSLPCIRYDRFGDVANRYRLLSKFVRGHQFLTDLCNDRSKPAQRIVVFSDRSRQF